MYIYLPVQFVHIIWQYSLSLPLHVCSSLSPESQASSTSPLFTHTLSVTQGYGSTIGFVGHRKGVKE